jgi:hypothetical protein
MKDRLVVIHIVMDSNAMWVRALGTKVITDVLEMKRIQRVDAEMFDEMQMIGLGVKALHLNVATCTSRAVTSKTKSSS